MEYDDDVIDVRDMIERYEELEDIQDSDTETLTDDEREEFKVLGDTLEDLAGSGGDTKWRGEWYPDTLVRDDYFIEYAEQLAKEIGSISRELSWPANCIDWEFAARELQVDYSEVEIEGWTYWYR